MDLDIIHQDEALLVVNKPAGLSTLPDGYNPALPHVKSLLQQQFGRLWVVHRLDKDTSGVLLLARTAQVHRLLNEQFEHHQVRKVYHALAAGVPDWQEKTVDLPLRSNGDRRHRTVVDLQAGRPATTHFRVLGRLDQYCLVEAVPETGRTHQIRAHLSSLGLSILGDKLYAPHPFGTAAPAQAPAAQEMDKLLENLVGMGLHARSLEITHPETGERLKFEAPYPAGWELVLKRLASKQG